VAFISAFSSSTVYEVVCECNISNYLSVHSWQSYTHTHTHARARAHTRARTHAHTRAHARTRAHTRTHMHTRAHTHTLYKTFTTHHWVRAEVINIHIYKSIMKINSFIINKQTFDVYKLKLRRRRKFSNFSIFKSHAVKVSSRQAVFYSNLESNVEAIYITNCSTLLSKPIRWFYSNNLIANTQPSFIASRFFTPTYIHFIVSQHQRFKVRKSCRCTTESNSFPLIYVRQTWSCVGNLHSYGSCRRKTKSSALIDNY